MEQLPGSMGSGGEVFRAGDVVVRPAGRNDDATLALLRWLSASEFPAPVPMGADPAGRRRYEWIEGDVGIAPFPRWVMTDAALASAGQLLRAYHETVAGLQLPEDLSWSDEMADPEGGPIICHNDVCPENVVYRDGQAVALLDFDFAAPGRRLWDLAQMARMWAPLRPPGLRVAGMEHLDAFHRLGILGKAYGIDATAHDEFVEIIVEGRRHANRFLRRRFSNREPAFVEAWEPLGGEAALDQILAWMLNHRGAMVSALQ